jgi:erythromycin esterase
MVVWAHNGHVSLRDPFGAVHPLGEHLRRHFGAGYLALGSLFERGSFLALDASRRRETLAERILGPAPAGDLGAAFARASLPCFLLDLRRLPIAIANPSARAGGGPGPRPEAIAAEWLRGRHSMRETGAIFTGEGPMTWSVVLPERYDAVAFVARLTSARRLPGDGRALQ